MKNFYWRVESWGSDYPPENADEIITMANELIAAFAAEHDDDETAAYSDRLWERFCTTGMVGDADQEEIKMTLLELTNHEAGIIIYGNNIVVDNWASYDDDQIPKLFFGGCVGFPVAPGSVEAMAATMRRVEHILDAMPDADLAVIESDHNGDVPRIYNGDDDEPGSVYDLPDGGVLIVPDEWC